MNWVRWPVGGTNPTGILNYKNLRLGQIPEMWWAKIETSAGVYSAAALANLDSIVSFNRTNGVSMRFGLYYTPNFYAGTTPNPTHADNITKGPWQSSVWGIGNGEASNPTSLTAVANFVTMIVNRYNKPGGAWYDANFATKGKGIQSWEPWTEPGMDSPGNGNTTGLNGAGLYGQFWWGTGTQMVDLCATQYAAIKALDPSIVISSPSFSPGHGAYKDMDPFMSTVGPVTAKTGLQSCDVFAWHPYQLGQIGHTYLGWDGDISTSMQGVDAVRNWMRIRGINLELWADEWGWETFGDSPTGTTFHNALPDVRYKMMARFLMCTAALGVKNIFPWHWEYPTPKTGPSGNWINDLTGVTLAYNDFAVKASGKTIIKGDVIPNSIVSLYFSDGTSWIV